MFQYLLIIYVVISTYFSQRETEAKETSTVAKRVSKRNTRPFNSLLLNGIRYRQL